MENKIKNAIQLTEQLLQMAQFMDKENHKTPDEYHLQPLGVSAFSFHLGNLLELLREIDAEEVQRN